MNVVTGDVLAEAHDEPEHLAAPHHHPIGVVLGGPVLPLILSLQHVYTLHPQAGTPEDPGRGSLCGFWVVIHFDQVGFRHLVGQRNNCVSSLGRRQKTNKRSDLVRPVQSSPV